jgi:AcrR family transcriptional regulator
MYGISVPPTRKLPPFDHRQSAKETRGRILLFAQQAFSLRGYGDVGVREIAAAAACDTALIRRYFGSKAGLFEEALAQALDVAPLLDGPRASFGARTVRFFMRDRKARVQPIPMMIFATSDPVSRSIAMRLLERQVVEPIVTWLGTEDARTCAARISMLCSGYFIYNQILPIEGGKSGEPDCADEWLAAQLQQIVDRCH